MLARVAQIYGLTSFEFCFWDLYYLLVMGQTFLRLASHITRQKMCAHDHDFQISFGRFGWKLLDGWKLLNWPGTFEEFKS